MRATLTWYISCWNRPSSDIIWRLIMKLTRIYAPDFIEIPLNLSKATSMGLMNPYRRGRAFPTLNLKLWTFSSDWRCAGPRYHIQSLWSLYSTSEVHLILYSTDNLPLDLCCFFAATLLTFLLTWRHQDEASIPPALTVRKEERDFFQNDRKIAPYIITKIETPTSLTSTSMNYLVS